MFDQEHVFFHGYGAVLDRHDSRLADAFGRAPQQNTNPGRHAQLIDGIPEALRNGTGEGRSWTSTQPALDTFIAERIIRSSEQRPELFEQALSHAFPLSVIRRESIRLGVPFPTLMYDASEHVASRITYTSRETLGGLLALGSIETHVLDELRRWNRQEHLRAPGFMETDELAVRRAWAIMLTHRTDGYDILRAGCSMEQVVALNKHPNSAVSSGQALSETIARAVPVPFAVAAFAGGADSAAIVIDAYAAGVPVEYLLTVAQSGS